MTMDDDNSILPPPKRTPWNKGKLIGAKPPLLARHVWSIRTRLQIERRTRDLAMFNLAIDSKLRIRIGARREKAVIFTAALVDDVLLSNETRLRSKQAVFKSAR